MIIKKKVITVSVLTMLVIVGIAAVSKPNGKHKNLKILPNDISVQKLDSLDYASDKHEMKENARKMMRMTIEINRTNFYFDTTQRPEYLKVVNCKTCHRGEPYPVD